MKKLLMVVMMMGALAARAELVQLNISSSFNYDSVVTDAERANAISAASVYAVLGDHRMSISGSYAFTYNPTGAANKQGLPGDGLITATSGRIYEFGKGLPVGENRYGTNNGATKVNNTVATKGDGQWVTITLPSGDQQKYSDFNVLMSSRRYAQTKNVTLTANLEYKYAGDATWYSVINESVNLSAAGSTKGGALGGKFDGGGSTAPALDGVWSAVAMPASGMASGSPTTFSTTQTYAFELATPVALDNTKTLEAIRIKTGTTTYPGYYNEAFLYGLTATIPEPATVGMLGLGALVTLLIRRVRA